MQAARFYGPGDIRVEEVDRPKAENDKVIVAVEWCGICGSDLSEYSHGESRWTEKDDDALMCVDADQRAHLSP
jgi:threonine dehydrogenase-like Zn-dependent dehydrogenase